MTTFIDDNDGPQSLSSRRSLRSGVSLSSHADRAKDDILVHLSSFVRKRDRGRRRSHVQIDADSADGSVARPSNREQGRRHRDYVQIEASRTDGGIQPADRLDPRDAEAAEAIEGGRATATAEADPPRRMERAQRSRRKRRLRLVGHDESDETEPWGNDGRAAEDDCFEGDDGSGSDGGGERSQGTASERGEDLALTVSHPPLKGPSDAGALDGSLRTAASASSGTFSCSGNSGTAIVGVGGGSGSRYSRRPLHPRQDLWLVLAVSQAVAIGSLHQASIGHGRYSAPRSGAEVAALTLSAISFAVSLAMGMGYLHGPFRDCIASDARSGCAVTAEQLLALLLLLLTSIQAGLVLNPDGGENYLAVEGTEIWNANLFCAAWAGLYGSAHLVADAFFCGDGGVKRWCMAAFSSLCASAALLEAYAGPNCRGDVLAGSAYCDAALNAGMLDVCAAVLALLAAAVTLLLRRRRIRGHGPWHVEEAGFNSCLAGFVAASVMFIVHSVNVGLASSPGGPGSDAGSVFVASWSAWIYSATLWKAAAESFLVGRGAPPEDVKPLEKEHKLMHRRRRAARMNGRLNGSHRSGGERTQATDEDPTDDESEFEASLRALGASLRAMEEGDGDSYEFGRSGDEDSMASHSKAPLCLETIPRSRSDGRRRRPPDPDGSEGNVGYAHDRSQASSEGRSRNRSRVNPDGYYSPRESGGSSRRGNPEGYDPRNRARDATDYHEPTSGLDGSSYSSAYYSGSQAVNVRVDRQEDVSTLGGTVGGWTSGSSGSRTANVRAERQEDASAPDGTLGGRSSGLARSRGSVTSGPPATVDPEVPNQARGMRTREYAQEGPSTGTRPILRAPLSHDDDAGPVHINLRQDRSASPAANRAASQQSMDVDKEWDFDHRAPPAPHNQRRVGHSMDRIKALAAQARAVPTGAVPTARGPSPKPGLARRASRDSMMSNFSPIEEGSEETSPSTRASTTKSVSVSQLSSSKSGSDPSSRSKIGSGSRSTRSQSRGKSRSKGRSKNTKSGSTRSTGKSDRRRTPKRGREKPPPRSNNGEKEKPPPPPRPSKKDQNNQGMAREDSDASSSNPTTVHGPTSKNKPSNGSSSDPSKTVNESLDDYIASKNPVSGARERKGPAARSSGSVSTSSSDFDVVISGNHSVMTELTQDEFDIPASGDVFHIASSALNAIAEAKYVTTTARAERKEKAARRKGSNYTNQTASTSHPRSSDLPSSIPARLPLYNGSDSSSTSRTQGDSDETPPGYGERKEHPSVEDILASAVKGARIPQNYDAEEVAFSTEDEGEDGSPPGYGERKERRSVEDILVSALKSARRRNYNVEDFASSTVEDEGYESAARRHRQRELQRNSGGVNSPGGSREEGRGGGGRRRKKSSESKRSGRSSRGKAPSGEQQDFRSDPETTRRSSLRERAIPVPTKGATPPRRRSRSEESSTAFLDSALKISELAIAGGRRAGGRPARRESSMRSFYSEEESHSEYGDYVC